jgi:hypothetical protein
MAASVPLQLGSRIEIGQPCTNLAAGDSPRSVDRPVVVEGGARFLSASGVRMG